MSDNKDNFGIILTFLVVVFFIVSGVVIWVFLFSHFAFVNFLKPEQRIDSGIKALTSIGASLGGIALLTNAYYASRTAKAANENAKAANENAEIARDKQITERFAKAIELLGGGQIEVKLGGIYALEQIAKAVRNRVYTGKTHLRGFQILNFPLVHGGGLCLCSREFHSPWLTKKGG